MLRRNLSVKIGFGYLNGGAGFFLCGFPWIEFWWWLCSAIGWNVLKVDEKERERETERERDDIWNSGINFHQRSNSDLLFNFEKFTIPVPSPMKRFWKYLQGDLHIALLWGHLKRERQETNFLSHSHSWWLQLSPPFPTKKIKWEPSPAGWRCCYIYHSTEPLRYTSTCRGQSRGGCTGRTCRRSWCSTSRASCSTWGSGGLEITRIVTAIDLIIR